MSKRGKDEWLQDVDARQRNVVFPDTALNEGRFWRNLSSSKEPLTFLQWIGVLTVLATLLACLTAFWPRGEGAWWQKVIDGYGVFFLLTVAFVTFIVIGNRRARRKAGKR
jgi:hypothetical protein